MRVGISSFWSRLRLEGYLGLYIMLLPSMVLLIIFKYIPMNGIVMAFQDYNIFDGILNSPFVGLENFKQMFSEEYFIRAIKNTLKINIIKMLFYIPLPIILALMLNETIKRFNTIVQTVVYLPHFFSWVIVGGIFVSLLSVNGGLVNSFLRYIGMKPIRFLFDGKYFIGVIVFSAMWKEIGWGSIVYMSSITSIDPQIYEAATIDGASKLRQMISVTIPNIKGAIVLMTLLSLSNILGNSFEQILIMYNPAVYDVADIISTYVFRSGINQMQYGYSSAVGLFNSLIGFLLLVSSNFLCRKYMDRSIW